MTKNVVESICGDIDDSQHVELYNGSLGVTAAFVAAHQAPVGQLQWNGNLAAIYANPGNVAGVRWGSGTLISRDLYLTAGHCFDQSGGGWQRPLVNGTFNVIPPAEIATNMHVNFNYQLDPAAVLRPEQAFAVTQLVEYRLGGIDFAIVRLAGNPGDIFGWTQISANDGALGEMLCIIGHPAGVPKQIEAGPLFHLHDDRLGYDTIDTLGGSSGSGVLRSPDGLLVGVHTNGGCSAEALSHNHGMRITSITQQSPTIQWLIRPTMKIADDGAETWKFADDAGTIKVIDDGVLKIKFTDDGGKLKIVDDGGKLKIRDDIGKLPPDDVKLPLLDKQLGDGPWPPNATLGGNRPAGISGGVPFILSTPHHSMAWATGSGDPINPQMEAALASMEQQLQRLMLEVESLGRVFNSHLRSYRQPGGGFRPDIG